MRRLTLSCAWFRGFLLAVTCAALLFGGTAVASASGPQVTVMYPVNGTLTSSPLESPPHHHYWGNFAIDDATSAGTPVQARFANPTGGLSLAVVGTFEPCATAGTGGTGVMVNVSVDGQLIGRV